MTNKVIWITGGSSGIGKSLAYKFANEGWQVAISARRENLLKEISESSEKIKSFPLDVTDKVKCKEVFISAPAAGGSEIVEIYAELTSIPKERMFSLDGVNGVS